MKNREEHPARPGLTTKNTKTYEKEINPPLRMV